MNKEVRKKNKESQTHQKMIGIMFYPEKEQTLEAEAGGNDDPETQGLFQSGANARPISRMMSPRKMWNYSLQEHSPPTGVTLCLEKGKKDRRQMSGERGRKG